MLREQSFSILRCDSRAIEYLNNRNTDVSLQPVVSTIITSNIPKPQTRRARTHRYRITQVSSPTTQQLNLIKKSSAPLQQKSLCSFSPQGAELLIDPHHELSNIQPGSRRGWLYFCAKKRSCTAKPRIIYARPHRSFLRIYSGEKRIARSCRGKSAAVFERCVFGPRHAFSAYNVLWK